MAQILWSKFQPDLDIILTNFFVNKKTEMFYKYRSPQAKNMT